MDNNLEYQTIGLKDIDRRLNVLETLIYTGPMLVHKRLANVGKLTLDQQPKIRWTNV